ncbi:MAG: aminotransferase class I/II-fold pyridoxal phosphate-dependent enzyme [Eubacteriaceae bacterium]|jgi:Cystathionine beta-lyases/cystathionine gamma-synthases|nr:aminotransferase class I/II-fold pyridoxal phosphate-dependent enzyme [Eubacteriaceae bacterium]
MSEKQYKDESEMLYQGRVVKGMDFGKPEAMPLFTTAAFTMNSMTEVKNAYANGFTYVRTSNPNREALAQVVSFLEGGEKSLIFSSGMGAISTTLMTLVGPGDHIICNSNIYGETFDVMGKLLRKFGVETELVNFDDMDNVKNAVKPNTKVIYSEVCANPTLNMCDIPAAAKIAHDNGALLMIDNTFTTPIAIKPIQLGADVVINSLTKFMNGHSDSLGGSITSTAEIIDAIHPVRMLTGTPGDPNASYNMFKNFETMYLRVSREQASAAKLAKALEDHPHVSKVNHPSLVSFPQHELATKLFRSNEEMSGMMSFIVPEQEDRFDDFLSRLHFAHYAMTLGTMRTTLVHPCTSSHSHMPDADRRKMGITPGMFRLSTGIENVDDLIEDFYQALKAFD